MRSSRCSLQDRGHQAGIDFLPDPALCVLASGTYNGAHGMALTSGTKLGPYEIQSVLAAGPRSSSRHRLSGDGVSGGEGPRLPQDTGRPLTMNDSSGWPINASPTN